jgi:hypothetical protein
MFPFDLEAVDVDGAVRDAADSVSESTRRAMLRGTAVAGGTVAAGALLGVRPDRASARSRKLDYQILNFALTLEYLEAAFYRAAVNSGALSGPTLNFAKLVGQHEQTHVSLLRTALKKARQSTVAQPKFNFAGTTDDPAKFLKTSFTLENEGVKAYLGQAGRIKSGAYLSTAARIVTTEARHAAGAAILLNQMALTDKSAGSVTPSGAFDVGADRASVLATVKSTGFITG